MKQGDFDQQLDNLGETSKKDLVNDVSFRENRKIDVSFVIPALNEALYIEAAMASVLSQTWPLESIEAIVVDNGSTDDTAQVVRTFADKYAQLNLRLLHESQRGRSWAKNSGAAAAQGCLLVFLDADSRAAPDLAEHVMRYDRKGYQAGCIRVRADSRDALDRAFFGLIEFGKLLFAIRAQLFYCRRELFFLEGGFDPDLQIAEDQDFLKRLQRRGHRVCYITESWIATSPRRLRALPLRLGMVTLLGRWALSHVGIGRRWPY